MTNLTPQKIGTVIRLLRTEKSISQEQLSKALNIPRPSISQIENGGRDLSFLEFQKILQIFEISFEDFLSYAKPKSQKKQSNIPNAINKTIPFSPEKFKQLILYILEKCGSQPNVGETVLYKLLYFCDFDYFEMYEKPLTGMKYKKMQFGPVPEQSLINPVIKDMREAGLIERVVRPYIHDTVQTRYINFVSADLSLFGAETDKFIKIADSVIGRLSHMSARQIEDHVHRDFPWQSHEDNQEIDYSSVFFRSGEFAQRDYDAMWEQSSSGDILKELGDMSDEENEYYLKLLKND